VVADRGRGRFGCECGCAWKGKEELNAGLKREGIECVVVVVVVDMFELELKLEPVVVVVVVVVGCRRGGRMTEGGDGDNEEVEE